MSLISTVPFPNPISSYVAVSVLTNNLKLPSNDVATLTISPTPTSESFGNNKSSVAIVKLTIVSLL